MDVEVDLFGNLVFEEDAVEVEIENDKFGDEGERCGICMEIVVDRGVLDCCQHWFCFVCIDNWATITNLCPLCQNQFQLITCVPVYDTIGSAKTDEDSGFRDDDCHIEGENNTLLFPSYYIDENAVACLDEAGCKIRNGSLTAEESLTLDTSIACDSCDIWYHAFCVGFDPEATDVESWLCPRCHASGFEQKSEIKGLFYNDGQQSFEHGEHSLKGTFTGKLSVSVADDGETALVISRIGGENHTKEPTIECLPAQEGVDYCETERPIVSTDCFSSESVKSLDQRIKDDKSKPAVPRVKLGERVVRCEPYVEASNSNLDLGLSLALTTDVCLRDALDKKLSADEVSDDVKSDPAPKLVKNRKRSAKRDEVIE